MLCTAVCAGRELLCKKVHCVFLQCMLRSKKRAYGGVLAMMGVFPVKETGCRTSDTKGVRVFAPERAFIPTFTLHVDGSSFYYSFSAYTSTANRM